ncbi:MAG: hypothetical protein WBF38_01820 [Nitrosotalea sp.]
MADDQIHQVEELIKDGKGDPVKLEYILNVLKKGTPLFPYDKKYLEKLIDEHFPKEKPQQEPTKISKIESKLKENEVNEDDYSLMILKNRLAKGEITVDEFDTLTKTLIKNASVDKIKNKIHNEKKTKPQQIITFFKVDQKKVSVAVILAVILGLIGLQGIGHIYAENIKKGVGLLIVSIAIVIAGFSMVGSEDSIIKQVGTAVLLGYIGMYIWQIFDARKVCKQHNQSSPDAQVTRNPELEEKKSKAIEAHSMMRYEESLEICHEILDKFPRDLDTLKFSAQTLEKIKRYHEAKEIYKFMLTILPENKGIKKLLKKIDKNLETS